MPKRYSRIASRNFLHCLEGTVQSNNSNQDDQWEDIVRRLGGTQDQAQSEPVHESSSEPDHEPTSLSPAGPRDYTVAKEFLEDFQPPSPKPITTGSPRTVLSWLGVIGPVTIWVLAALLVLLLVWCMYWPTMLAIFAVAVSLFFLLPKSWAHREPFDDDDFGR